MKELLKTEKEMKFFDELIRDLSFNKEHQITKTNNNKNTRNSKCSCGSGKKYKMCCMIKNTKQLRTTTVSQQKEIKRKYIPVTTTVLKSIFKVNYVYLLEHIYDENFNFIINPNTLKIDIEMSENYNQNIWEKLYSKNHIRICNDGFIVGIHKTIINSDYVEVDIQRVEIEKLQKLLTNVVRTKKLEFIKTNNN